MRISSALIVLTAIAFTACASKNPAEDVAGGPLPPANMQTLDHGSQIANDEIAKRLLDAINQQRTANALNPLAMSPELARSAQQHSDTMVSGNFLSTRGAGEPSAITRITSQGVKTLKLGENVVRIQTQPDRVADETVSTWMGAAADRKNLLSTAFTRTGIGVTRAIDGDYYVSADFAQ